ncbi:MAG TPA: hypothetical protein PK054_11050 [Anaerohalosphaeraceae bacterium]|nr:hypothetical protein [Anaerohalosphaeraceae bacterium]HOL89509.1 hypothetical protein [Anaerohalosphaeraceae bacterium]HPP57101.1 hypothetical protein [Anaerohalosphaeraceae bacterium]
MFRFFFIREPFRQAGRSLAVGAFLTGLFLIGFGLLVFILRDLFAFLAAAIFFAAGFSAIGYAVRVYWLTRQMDREHRAYRENVEIHFPDLWQ